MVFCGDVSQLYEFIKKYYVKRYLATYYPTAEWIKKAVDVYLYGVLNNVGITVASYYVSLIHRFSYTRMANFIRELGLWVVYVEDWILPICQKTLLTSYVSESTEEWNLTLNIPHPFTCRVRPTTEEDAFDFLDAVADTLERGAPTLAMSMGVDRIGEEPMDAYTYFKRVVKDGTVRIEYELTWSRTTGKGKKTYHYSGTIWMDVGKVWIC